MEPYMIENQLHDVLRMYLSKFYPLLPKGNYELIVKFEKDSTGYFLQRPTITDEEAPDDRET